MHLNRCLALTFDDGPSDQTTEALLDSLEQYGVKATFFLVGQRVAVHPNSTRKIVSFGHELGNHSYSHPMFHKITDEQVRIELSRTQEEIYRACGVVPRWFRPPYGFLLPTQRQLVKEQDLTTILWNVDPQDWSRPGTDSIVKRIVENIQTGSIILCHDLHYQTVEAIPFILDHLLDKGYEFLTVTELRTREHLLARS